MQTSLTSLVSQRTVHAVNLLWRIGSKDNQFEIEAMTTASGVDVARLANTDPRDPRNLDD